jgi:CRP-like cAMP-binding protein
MAKTTGNAMHYQLDQRLTISDALLKLELFEDLKTDEIDQIAAISTMRHLLDGTLLIQENDIQSFDLYVLCNGSLEVVSSNSEATSSEVVISKDEKNIFGEIGWLCQKKRTADVRCYGPVEVIQIDGEGLRQFMQNNPQAGFNILRRTAVMVAESLTQTSGLLKQVLWANNI